MPIHLPPEIFKAYDIRGIVGQTLTAAIVESIGRAIGSEARDRGRSAVVIGRDGRHSGPELSAALAAGLRASGVDVTDVGQVATPLLYFATHHLGTQSGVMVTGSHNPPEYNGLKVVLAGDTLAGDAIQQLRLRFEQGKLARGAGTMRTQDIREDYLRRITSDIKLARPMRLVVDCGNGVAGGTAPELYRRLGCEVAELYCDVDGSFPNHHPDPSHPENLADVQRALAAGKGELGLAFDGDGDRLGVVTRNGRIIYPDRQLMLFAAEVLSRNPGAEVIFDVKSTRHLFEWIRKHGGRPVMWKTGHSFIKQKLKETGAPLAGEMSGHVFFKDRWYGFDDALYAGARLLELLSREKDPSAVLEGLPDAVNTPELHLKLAEGENYTLMEKLKASARFDAAREVITIDGLRVEYADGFGLARPSNTTPVIVLRFEADDEAGLRRIQGEFRRAILAVKPDARLPF
jgi:phosphomannomutase/phosphoglucomutase